ncbi:MAG: transcriptional regulator [Candidatus Sericytochromatia bacterium]|nr:transcriptional regulator [Candidatus Tanganyikabacteria bacterium]
MSNEFRNYLALAALGPDRPGLVAEATAFVSERGGNVEDSRMAILGAEFGILLLVSGAPDAAAAIERDLAALAAQTGLEFQVRRTSSPEEHRREAGIPCVVTAEALDHEGIVQAVAGALHRVGVNIVSLTTEAYQAPITGSPLFRMEARIDVPPGRTVSDVRQSLDEVARKENLDIEARTLAARA